MHRFPRALAVLAGIFCLFLLTAGTVASIGSAGENGTDGSPPPPDIVHVDDVIVVDRLTPTKVPDTVSTPQAPEPAADQLDRAEHTRIATALWKHDDKESLIVLRSAQTTRDWQRGMTLMICSFADSDAVQLSEDPKLALQQLLREREITIRPSGGDGKDDPTLILLVGDLAVASEVKHVEVIAAGDGEELAPPLSTILTSDPFLTVTPDADTPDSLVFEPVSEPTSELRLLDRRIATDEPATRETDRNVTECEWLAGLPGVCQHIDADGKVAPVAAGRLPNTDGIGLETAGVELDARGYVKVNERLETTAPNVWAVG